MKLPNRAGCFVLLGSLIILWSLIIVAAYSLTHALTPIAPYPSAPLCPDSGESHDHSLFHTLWDETRGCHYDHEHGANPFTSEVASVFPGFDLQALIGDVGIGHTNPSSEMENTHKHGGFKWNVQLHHPQTCAGFEGATTGVDGSVIQFHGFGDYSIEAEGRIHSTVALLRQCRTSNPTDYGYVFVNQLQDYGQRITPYQGVILPYPNQPIPAYSSPFGPYLSFDCLDLIAPHDIRCRSSFAQATSANSNWTSKVTGSTPKNPIGGHSDTSPVFRLLWRVRDTYQLIDWNDQDYPFTFRFICGDAVYDPAACKFNNSTTQVHEVAGVIPVAWDNLSGWDTNSAVGRITAEGYVTTLGAINPSCAAPSTEGDCFPIKLVDAFTGAYGSVLVFTNTKGINIVPVNPERDIFFCNGVVCSETSTGAIPSGWIGAGN